jgi:hypothetical protein
MYVAVVAPFQRKRNVIFIGGSFLMADALGKQKTTPKKKTIFRVFFLVATSCCLTRFIADAHSSFWLRSPAKPFCKL